MHQDLVQQIIEKLQICDDEALLDLVLKLFLESGY